MLWDTAVRCATGSNVVSSANSPVTRTVRSRVEPPAPYVMETKAGPSLSNVRTARHRRASASASRGGENSTENGIRLPVEDVIRSTIDGVRLAQPSLERPLTASNVTR